MNQARRRALSIRARRVRRTDALRSAMFSAPGRPGPAVAFFGMALYRFANRRGDRTRCDRSAARCGRCQRSAASFADSAADRVCPAGREPAQRRNRVTDLPRRRRRCRGVVQPCRRRAGLVGRGRREPGSRLRAGAALYGRNRVRKRPGQQHGPAIRRHLWGVASVGASDAIADHHGRGLRHDAGASDPRTFGPAPAHQLLFGMGDCGLRRQRAGVRADGIASPPHHRALVSGPSVGGRWRSG